MPTTVINVKTDITLKRDAKEVAADLGLPLGTIINSYLRALVRERRVVFSTPPAVNRKTTRLLEDIERDVQKGKNADGPFSYNEAVRYLSRLFSANLC
jgi:addiction module RelB/DinJ family antitoxin